MPSGFLTTRVEPMPTIQNTLPFHATASRYPTKPAPRFVTLNARVVHDVPFVEVAKVNDTLKLVTELVSLLIAKNTVPFQATPLHVCEVGSVLEVQVIPSGDAAACVPPEATATNRVKPLAHAIADQFALAGKVRAVQVIPSGEVAAAV